MPLGSEIPALRLAIEGIGVKHGGGATVLNGIIDAALVDVRFSEVSIFCSPSSRRHFDFPASPRLRQIPCSLAEKNKLFRLWWLEYRLPPELRSLHADVLICLSGAGRGGASAPHLTMIQQSLPFSAEATSRAGIAARIRLNSIRNAMRRSCLSSHKVIVQTETMKGIVENAFSMKPSRVEVIAPAAGPLPDSGSPLPKLAEMRASQIGLRLLYVGNDAPYKNLPVLLQAVHLLSERFIGLKLFLTWPVDHPLAHEPHVVSLGYLSRSELAEAYRLATVLVMPSLQETVGLPLLEAMTAGLPVIAADRPYAREVCGNAALFFDAADPSALAHTIAELLTDEQRRIDLASLGRGRSIHANADSPWKRLMDLSVEAAANFSAGRMS